MAYNPEAAYAYAHKWAYNRNPRYNSYSNTREGDSTNFVSQALYAGSGVMNFTNRSGWYSQNGRDSRSWYDAEALYTFLTTNTGVGPYGYLGSMEQAQPGDVIQLSYDGYTYTQSLLVVANRPEILVAMHDYDSDYRKLDSLFYRKRRLIRIVGARGVNNYLPIEPEYPVIPVPEAPVRPIAPIYPIRPPINPRPDPVRPGWPGWSPTEPQSQLPPLDTLIPR